MNMWEKISGLWIFVILLYIYAESIDNDYLIMLAIGCIAIAGIMTNGIYRCKYNDGSDILMTKSGIGDLDGWSATHFALFAYIGHRMPHMFIPAMIMGAAWEGMEHYMGDARPSWLGGFGDCGLTSDQLQSSHQQWWFGRLSDLVVNALGFLTGAVAKSKMSKGYINLPLFGGKK